MDRIKQLIMDLAQKETHHDKVACVHSVLMEVNMMIGNEMLKLRQRET